MLACFDRSQAATRRRTVGTEFLSLPLSAKNMLHLVPRLIIVDYRYTDYRLLMPKRKLDPLPSAAFHILLSLAEEDLHGYAIMRQVAEQTDGRMRLGPGTLYSSIQSLLEEKFIEELEPREDLRLGQERRRYYRMTSAGRKLARSEAERLAGFLRVARTRKILRGDYV
jgi:DNA-binding PadR family transcriptional regulator